MDTSDIVMACSIAVIMFGIGLELKFKDFKRVFWEPKAIITGLVCQILFLPVIALGLIYFWPMKPIYKIGIMLLAACPGGTASNLVTRVLKGRVALSVSLTSFNSFLILFTIPLIIELSYAIFGNEIKTVDLGFWDTMREVLLTVVLPVFSGMLIGNLLNEHQRERIHKPLTYILPLFLLGAVIAVLFLDDNSRDIQYLDYLPLLFPLFILNLSTILAGFFTGKYFKLSHDSSYTIGIEMGLQNSVLALYIGNQLLNNRDLSLIAILYGSFSLISTFTVGYFLKRSERKN